MFLYRTKLKFLSVILKKKALLKQSAEGSMDKAWIPKSLPPPPPSKGFDSPSFCVFPFMHFLAGPTDHWRLCCVAKEAVQDRKLSPYLLSKHSPERLWNSFGIRNIRRKMWRGEAVSQCRHCYYQESVKRKSYRQRSNEEWLKFGKTRKIIQSAVQNDFYVDQTPLYMDLRPGNLCNLKCRMCNPGNSSKIEGEWKALRSKPLFLETLGQRRFMFQKNGAPSVRWEKSQNFWRSIERWSKNILKLYLTGGEPTLIKNNWKLIDHIQKSGLSNAVELIFNINCTRVPKELTEALSRFKRVCLNLSVDGTGPVNDYIRSPSRWKDIDFNIRYLLQAPGAEKTDFRLTPVVQIYNILNLPSLFHYADRLEKEFSKKIVIELLILDDDPSCLDIRALPDSVREIALNGFRKYLQGSKRPLKDKAFKNSLESVMHILENVVHPERGRLLKRFENYTRILDIHRGESYERALPALSRLLPAEDSKEDKKNAGKTS